MEQERKRTRQQPQSGHSTFVLHASTRTAKAPGNYDAVLIPGGGVRAGGMLPDWVRARFDHALTIPGDPYLIPLSAGTVYRPPVTDAAGRLLTEARAGAQYLIRNGVDPARILLEEQSYDTLGNAYFALIEHVIPRRLERLLVISSQFHIERTRAVFEWIINLHDNRDKDARNARRLDFAAVPDVGVEPDALSARVTKEREAMKNVERLRHRLPTLPQFQRWLFSEHAVYSGSGGETPWADPRTY